MGYTASGQPLGVLRLKRLTIIDHFGEKNDLKRNWYIGHCRRALSSTYWDFQKIVETYISLLVLYTYIQDLNS